MALNFPNSPVVGQIYQSGSLSWRWDGTSWVSQGAQAISGTLVSANSGPILSGVSLNFVNTSTVSVSVTSGSSSNVANIGFTSTAGGTGTVQSVGTGLGLTGGGFTTSGTISANIANTTIQGVTKLIDVVTSTDSGNAATANIVNIAFNQATNAYTQANTANSIAISAYGQANAAYAQANTANSTAISAYGQANAAYNQANSANSIAISAYGQANAAFTAANNAANTVRVTANSGVAQSAVSLNFINTASVIVSVGAGSAGTANVGFSAVSGSTTVPGILQLNDTVTSTSTTLAATANAVKNTYDFAATKYASTGGTISGDVTITGNLIITGGTSQLNVTNLSVNDSIILLGSNNIADVLDIGFVGHYRRGATDTHAGIIRKAADKTFYIFDNYEVEPTNNVIDITGNNFRLGNVRLGIMNANSILVLGTSVATVTDVGFAYGQANSAYAQANLAYTQANTANSIAISAYGQANAAYTQANTANSIAISAYGQANAAFTAANNAANTVRVTANSGSAQSAVSLNFINTASVLVSVGAGTAGNANVSFSAVAGTTAVAGILQLTDSVTSTSTTTAATPNSVKSAFDQATLAYGQANTANTTAVSAYGQANAAFAAANNAANAVRVTANSGPAISNVSLNFVNTATVQVSVTNPVAGIANIAFTSLVTGGGTGTLNNFPVSVNTGSTVSSNGLNFINSATVTVSVTQGIGGNANVSFTSVGGTATPGGSNTQIQFNNNGTLGASSKFTYNTAPNLVSVDADLKLANTNKLYFGGEQANNSVANSRFSISFNVSATSLDFTFLG